MYRTPGFISGRGQNIFDCDYTSPPPIGQVCDVDIKIWSPCVQEYNYNFHRSAPCVFLNLNNINGWIPEFYNKSDSLPEKMPMELKDYIKELEKIDKPAVSIFLL